MAENKNRSNEAEKQPQAAIQGAHLTEASPNPHNETGTTDRPVTTDHRHIVGKENVAQTPSTAEGWLNPSVTEAVEGGSIEHDSIFNEVDPQRRVAGKEPVDSVVEGWQDPSAGQGVEGGSIDHDSMFNQVDPQTGLTRGENAHSEERAREPRKRVPRRKAA